jgi:transposase-like protein
VQLAISDDHLGLKAALAATLPGASWQRCRVHLLRNLLSRVPKSTKTRVATLVRSIFAQPDEAKVLAQLSRRFPSAAALLAEAAAAVLAFAGFSKKHRRQIWSNHPWKRLNREIRRRTDMVGIFPDRPAIVRLLGAILAEQSDEWAAARRYLGVEALTPVGTTLRTPP